MPGPRRAAYDFGADLKFGQRQERWLAALLGTDSATDVTIENKGDRHVARTSNVAIETSHSPGATGTFVPSGLMVTEADLFTITVVGDDGATPVAALVFPTALLRETVLRLITTGAVKVRALARAGSCPTKGLLVPLPVLLSALAATPTHNRTEAA